MARQEIQSQVVEKEHPGCRVLVDWKGGKKAQKADQEAVKDERHQVLLESIRLQPTSSYPFAMHSVIHHSPCWRQPGGKSFRHLAAEI